MPSSHPKSIRRRLLHFLYERYLTDPLEMLGPGEFFEALPQLSRQQLIPNMHYLADRRLVELMIGYNPPMFAAARITANGIDLVENRFEFNLRFPPEPGEEEETAADVPALMERLVEEAEFSPLDGEERAALLRDVQFLRDEFARPLPRWRHEVIESVLQWILQSVEEPESMLPSACTLKDRLPAILAEE